MQILFIICLLCISNATYLNKLEIIGNKHTKSDIIEREVLHLIPSKYDSIIANEDRNRIYNLGIFSTVKVYPKDSIYTIELVETIRFIPIPLVNYDEGKGISYGFGFANLNFRGLNEKLIIGGIKGVEEMYFINFLNPWIYGHRGSIYSNFYQLAIQSNVYNVKYKINGFEIGTGSNKGTKHSYNFSTGWKFYQINSTPIRTLQYDKFIISDYKSLYKYIISTFKYKYDSRDIYIDPTKGSLLIIKAEPKLAINSIPNRFNLNILYKKYISLNNIIFDPVFSIKSQILIKSTNQLPPFEIEYLGGENYVRGYSPVIQKNPIKIQKKIKDTSQLVYQNFELQHTLIKRKDYSKIEVGIDLAYFLDMGLASNKISSFKITNLILGYGFGLRFFLSGLGNIHLDIGFNPYGTYFAHPREGQN